MRTELIQVCQAGNNFDLQQATQQLLAQHGLIFGTEEDATDVEGGEGNNFSIEKDVPKVPNPTEPKLEDVGSDMSISDEEPKKSNTQIRKEKKAEVRKVAQRDKKYLKRKDRKFWNQQQFQRGLFDETLEHNIADSNISKLAHTKPGFIGLPTTTHPSKDFEIQIMHPFPVSNDALHPLCDADVQQKVNEGWNYIKNDLSCAQVISDCHGRKIAVKARQPRHPSSTWGNIKAGAFSAIKEGREELARHLQPVLQRSSTTPLKTRQREPGQCRHLTLGVSCGSGQSKPMVLRFQTQTEARVAGKLLNDPHIIQLINHVTVCLWTWYPELAEMYSLLQVQLDIFDELLSNIFKHSPFCGTTFNLGPIASTFEHRDSKNLIGGLCAIIVLGNFNHETSGHLLLHELRTIIEVRDGDVVFLPSAGIAHSNSKLRVGEDRCSLVQYTAGGNFRYTWPLEEQESSIQTEVGKKRWEECLELLGSIADLEEAKVTGKLPKRNMEELVNKRQSFLLPPLSNPT